MGAAGLLQARRGAKIRAGYDPRTQALLRQARERFDISMALGVFRDVAFHPLLPGKPAVPSAIVLSDESPAVLPATLAGALTREGWAVRRLEGLHHDMHLEDPARTAALLAEILRSTVHGEP
jgi:pimeloyl-ACP methyl ester carboxylesterase